MPVFASRTLVQSRRLISLPEVTFFRVGSENAKPESPSSVGKGDHKACTLMLFFPPVLKSLSTYPPLSTIQSSPLVTSSIISRVCVVLNRGR